MDISNNVLIWIKQAVGHRANIQTAVPLLGGVTTSVYRLAIRQNGRTFSLILRLFDNERWLAEEPDLAPHEAAVLTHVANLNLPTPELVACDETGDSCGVPAILMTELPGQVILHPANFNQWLDKLAETLVVIHTKTAVDFPWQHKSWLKPDRWQVPTWTQIPHAWEQAIAIAREPRLTEPAHFLHRDYHPMNILWQGERISGIVDWVNACIGPIGEDISHCRENLLLMYGIEAADHFLATYLKLAPSDFVYHPYWDIAVAMGMLPQPWNYSPWGQFGLTIADLSTRQARADQFLAQALAKYGAF